MKRVIATALLSLIGTAAFAEGPSGNSSEDRIGQEIGSNGYYVCRDGDQMLLSESNESKNGDTRYLVVCKDGRWYRVN